VLEDTERAQLTLRGRVWKALLRVAVDREAYCESLTAAQRILDDVTHQQYVLDPESESDLQMHVKSS
jgi:hypothetical protein